MIIDKVKYGDVFHKLKNVHTLFNIKCFICREKIEYKKYYYYYFNLSGLEEVILSGYKNSRNIRMCLNCIESPIQAETTFISLQKILFGGRLKIVRYESDTNNKKRFYY